MKNQWYAAKSAFDSQGLVIDEKTGENIAVTYKKENAPLVAKAPEMLALLKQVVAEGWEDNKKTVYRLISEAEGQL